jgi:hypothetical protein
MKDSLGWAREDRVTLPVNEQIEHNSKDSFSLRS